MTRFFLEELKQGATGAGAAPSYATGDRLTLGKADSHHLLRVMRADPGELFTALAGGWAYECRLAEVEGALAIGEVVKAAPAGGEPPVEITLFQGLAKGEKMETVIQHGTEIGICRFVPVASSRAVVKLEPKRAAERVERWQRIAREAAEQSRRGGVPTVDPVHSWKEAVARAAEFDLLLVPWEEGGEGLKVALATRPGARRIAVFVGPEGGLAPEEVALARQAGAVPITLGPRILRTETAPLVAAAVILFAEGDMG
jgi:16S rRNA (uracil1498-N3)-methyltransferase